MSKLHCVCLGLLLSLPVFACAQQHQSQPDLAGAPQKAWPAFVPPKGLISLDVVVTDKWGKPVSGLEAGDFTLLDNGQAEKMVSFQAFDEIAALPTPPAELILVIDAINLQH